MAKKKKTVKNEQPQATAEIRDQQITETLETNYMPYVMTVIVSRAIPEIDGFKPAHRKLLYTMYKMNLLDGPRTKCANIAGQMMKLNPHGTDSNYETLVRLTRDKEALLHPFVDSKGAFGKQYSRDMAFAASRYTEAKLDSFCREIFGGINKDAVDMVDNYDGTTKEPSLLPTSFPNVLVSPNFGIAVGMSSSICSFNLAEVCDATIELIKNSRVSADRLLDIIPAPDFSTGADIAYNRDKMRAFYETGEGFVRLRSRYRYDEESNCIEVLQIPYSTTIEQIMEEILRGMKEGKLKEISDVRDEIDISGFRLAIDLKKGVDPDKLMTKLYKMTPLDDNMKCCFNILINGAPLVLGVKDILLHWLDFRTGCLKRELTFDCNAKKDKLHLLIGLGKILLDIDKAIAIVRNTEKEADVVPNLAAAFDLTTIQAEFVADIKLRYLNREYIVNRVKEISALQKEIAELEDTIADDKKLRSLISKQLVEIKKKYGIPRKTGIIPEESLDVFKQEEFIEKFAVVAVFTKEGYFKKCLPASLRVAEKQLLKEGDIVLCSEETDNSRDVMFFSDKGCVYRLKLSEFGNTKASQLGDYVAGKLGLDSGEKIIYMKVLDGYDAEHNMVYAFANGKGVRVPMTAYETKSNRKKLTGAFSTASPPVGVFYEAEPFNLVLISEDKRAIMISTKLIPVKTTRTAVGVSLFKLKAGASVVRAYREDACPYESASKCRKIKIPASGTVLSEFDIEESQQKLEL